MRQDVSIIGTELSRLVPYSLALRGIDYAVTLVENPDVIGRATASGGHTGWLVLLLAGDEAVEACTALLATQPLTVLVTATEDEALRRRLVEADLPVVPEYEGPLPALALLLAMSRWAEAGVETNGAISL